MAKDSALRIGCSGWQYHHWKGTFYPEGLRPAQWFASYAGRFDTVEINNTFYRLPEAAVFEAWRRAAPEGFLYAVKYSRFGSHLKHLKDPETHVPRFVERAIRLGPALGPILVQLPPAWRPDPARLDAFLAATPKDWRWAVEVRNPLWLREEIYQILRNHGAALCLHDLIPSHPEIITSDWTYLRFHGGRDGGNYAGGELKEAAVRIRGYLREGLDVYAYFNNDAFGFAPANAADLLHRLEGP